jgi:ribosomal protein S16
VPKVQTLVDSIVCRSTLREYHACSNTPGISPAGAEKAAFIPHRRRKIKVISPSNLLVLNFRSGRQSKPLEVVGVYDPIPRYPTDPMGKVLEDQPKSKKVSMNMDRIRYWLGVGAQPTDHCARLLAKVLPLDRDKS